MSVYEDDIDLRPYISVVLKKWWQIILFGLLVGVAVFGYSRLQPQKFESTASILLTRTRTALTLAQEFPTITEPIDARSRMDALISIINSDALALATQQELISEIPDESRDLQIFKELVSVSSNGDVITITASAENPELAAKIANVWARQAVEAINQAYSSEQPLGEIQTQLVTAQKQYEISQEDLERFIENNQIELLNKRIGETLFLFSRLAEERTFQISFYFQRKQAMEDLEIRAEALKGQLQNGSLSNAAEIGDALAVLKMRATSLISRTNVFVEQDVSSGASQSINIPFLSQTEMDSGFVFSLQIDEFSNLLESPQDYLPDLETIVQMAQMEQIRASEEIERLSQQILLGSDYDALGSIHSQILELETQLERERARQLELRSKRDLAWQAYQAIAQKETEIRNVPQAVNQVNLASQAIPPQSPVPSGTARNTLIGGILGVFLGILWVVSSYWWRNSNHEVNNKQLSNDLTQEG